MSRVSLFEISYEPLVSRAAGGPPAEPSGPPFVEGYFLQITNVGGPAALTLRFTADPAAAAALTGTDARGAVFVATVVSLGGGRPALGTLARDGTAALPPLARSATLLFGLVPNPSADLTALGGALDICGQVELTLAPGAPAPVALAVLPQSRVISMRTLEELGAHTFAREGGGTLLRLP